MNVYLLSSYFLTIFKSNKHRGGNNYNVCEEGAKSVYKIWPSDEDKDSWAVVDLLLT